MEERDRVRPQTEESEAEAEVEGHAHKPRSDEADEAVRARRASEDPDVEGHSVRPSHKP
ncbi:MAG TPA: hypothetical protein VE644_10510 [Gaiellaceae bacterium]|jgi:hypothetical protein|nr:hypothetical protein [Gaiellaceae bacterium]